MLYHILGNHELAGFRFIKSEVIQQTIFASSQNESLVVLLRSDDYDRVYDIQLLDAFNLTHLTIPFIVADDLSGDPQESQPPSRHLYAAIEDVSLTLSNDQG